MAISDQSNGTHAVSFMVQKKRYRYGGFASVDDAELFEKQARNDLKKGKEVTPPNFSKIAKKAIQDMTVGFCTLRLREMPTQRLTASWRLCQRCSSTLTKVYG
jgi:hypothetical protein